MADFDPDSYLQSISETPKVSAPPSTFDPDKYLASISGQKQADSAPAQKPINRSFLGINYQVKPGDTDPFPPDADINATGISGVGGGGPVALESLKSMGGDIAGGLKGLWDLALGRSGEQAASDVQATQQSKAFSPQTPREQGAAAVASSNANPMNWLGTSLDYAGRGLANVSEAMGAPAGVQTALRVGPTALALGLGAAKGFKGAPEEAPTEIPNEAPKAAPEVQQEAINLEPEPRAMDVPPEEQTPAQQTQAVGERQQILQRVGLQNARESALSGDKKDAATDFQLSKTDTDAGQAAVSQFEHEKDAITGHAENVIAATGGTIGLDEDALANRGATISRPFDELRQLFKQQTADMYAKAQARSDELTANGNPTALTSLPSVQQILSDPNFQNTLLAKDQGNLLKAVTNQLQQFGKNNPNGFSPAAAEQFRQWLNQTWSPDNKWAIGQLTKAVDNDVTQSAGENVYAQARAINVLKGKTLDNPNGISDLFDVDPKNPINRQTPFEKIPDKIMRLPAEQFANVLDTLNGMPPELQDSAQAAIGEIKAHLVNKLLQAGSQTRSGAARNLWNSDAVNNVLNNNASKFRMAFGDDPEAASNIRDLKDAGDILKVESSYPGAYAQEINLKGRGITSKVLPAAGKMAGAAAGSTFGGIGAGAGTMAGGFLGEAGAAKLAKNASLNAWKKRIRKIGP